ncbi:MAG: acylphosphatase [Nitrospirales bacterium]|nr:MAG: acylphosphatase [Nitrospirales bacterium]
MQGEGQPSHHDLVRAHVVVEGRVQGVSYRAFTQQHALRLNLCGWVRNLASGHVECEAQGLRESVEAWLTFLRQGPMLAHVTHIHVQWISPENDVSDFHILRSS